MLAPCNKTFEYQGLVKKNKTVSLFINLSLWLGVVAAVGFFALALVVNSYIVLIPAALFLIAGFVAKAVLKSTFKKNSQKIANTYIRAYGVCQPNANIDFVGTNYGLLLPKGLHCWVSYSNNTLNFISRQFWGILDRKKFDAEYAAFLESDFGVLSILMDKIDHYMLKPNNMCTLVVYDDESVRRFDFRSSAFFDSVIPTLEYHFKTAKKD